jgi:hypothetical protein
MTFLCAWALYCAASPAPSLEFALAAQTSRADAPARVGHSRPGQEDSAASSPEAEVLTNLKAQAIGSATVADLDMPDEYLKRVAGRILRASFEENFRIVVPDEKPAADKPTRDPPRDKSSNGAIDPSTGEIADPKSHPSSTTGARTAAPASAQSSWPASPWLIGGGIGVCCLMIAAAMRRARRRGARA